MLSSEHRKGGRGSGSISSGVCGSITSSDREKIKAALAQRVPPITPEQEAACYLEPEESRQPVTAQCPLNSKSD